MSFIARLVSDNSISLEKFELGEPSSPATATPKEKFLQGSEFLFIATWASDLTSLAPLKLNGVPKLGSRTLIRWHSGGCNVVRLDTTGMISYQSLIIPRPYLAPLPRYSLPQVQNRYISVFGYPSRVVPLKTTNPDWAVPLGHLYPQMALNRNRTTHTHQMDHTQVNSTVYICTRTWCRIIYTIYTDVRIADLCRARYVPATG